jgi:ribosomal protein L11 methylase PrmA
MRRRADIVAANLTGGLLERSAAALATCVAPGGHLVVSGFMGVEKAQVVPALEKWLTLERSAREEEWECAVFLKGLATGSAEQR